MRSQTPGAASSRPSIGAGKLIGAIRLDGRLDEAAWQQAQAIENLTMSEPTSGIAPSARTIVRVLADAKTLLVGVRCEDADPAGIGRSPRRATGRSRTRTT